MIVNIKATQTGDHVWEGIADFDDDEPMDLIVQGGSRDFVIRYAKACALRELARIVDEGYELAGVKFTGAQVACGCEAYRKVAGKHSVHCPASAEVEK